MPRRPSIASAAPKNGRTVPAAAVADDGAGDAAQERPDVPALAKALDVLELLSASAGGLTMIQIAEQLGRSMGEIYRVVVFLGKRGYVAQDAQTGRYALTLRLFEMAHRHPPVNRLIKLALPILDALAQRCEQSCHLAVLSHSSVLVLASSPSPRPACYSVKAGAVFRLRDTSSGMTIVAFDDDAVRERALADFAPGERADAAQRLRRIRAERHERRDSRMVHGILNLSAPVFDHAGVVAAITMGFMGQVDPRTTADEALRHVVDSAAQLSAALGGAMAGPRADAAA